MFNDLTTIGEIAQVFDGPHATPTKTESGPYFLSISSLENGALDLSKSARLSEEDFHKWTKRVTPQEGDVLFSYETRLGEAALMPGGIKACLGRRMGLLRAERSKVLPEFLLYAYLSPPFQETIRANTIHGATVDRIALKDLPNYPIRIPSLSEQKKVISVLKGIYRKKTLNTQTNQTLESIAQAIFKSWFVDFEPVKAKMAAKERWYAMQPTSESASPVCYADEAALPDLETYTNLAAMCAISGKSEIELAQLQQQNPDQYQQLAETAALFPSAMVDSELGEIPEGWEVQSYSNLCKKIESGGTPKRNEDSYWGGDVRWLSSGEVRDRIVIDTKEKITADGLSNSSAKLWPKYTIVIAMYGATAGEACLLAEEMCANQACCGLISREEYVSFIYLSAIRSSQILSEKASGSAQQNLNKGIIEHHQLVAPPPELARLFELSTRKMVLKLIENYKQSAALAQLRDSLLPKLLSGEIDLTKIENEVI